MKFFRISKSIDVNILLSFNNYFIFFLVAIPNLVISKQFFITTHNIAKILIVINFIILFFRGQLIDKNIKMRNIFLIINGYIIFLSLSILGAVNIFSYLKNFFNIIISVLYFYTIFVKEKIEINKFIFIIYLSFIINLTIQFLNLIFPYTVNIIPYQNWEFINYQITRGKLFTEIMNEIFILLIFFIFYEMNKSKMYNFIGFFLIIVSIYFSILSRWTSKFVLMLISLLLFPLLFDRKKWFLIILLFFIFLIKNPLLNGFYMKSNIFGSAFIFEEDKNITFNARFNFWRAAYEMGIKKWLYGVGLGNFYDNLSFSLQIKSISSVIDLNKSIIVIDDPHNIFLNVLASSGVYALIFFVFLIFFFIIYDFLAIKENKDILLNCFIFSFWLLFLFGAYNPSNTFSYNFLLWGLRGIIFNLQKHNIKNKDYFLLRKS